MTPCISPPASQIGSKGKKGTFTGIGRSPSSWGKGKWAGKGKDEKGERAAKQKGDMKHALLNGSVISPVSIICSYSRAINPKQTLLN